MKKYKFLYLFWLLPAYFLFLGIQQMGVYYGLENTYEEGESYIAEVVRFKIEQVAAQRNGHVTIRFKTDNNQTVKLTLAVSAEVVARISKASMVPIRYDEGAFVEAVLIPTYKLQQSFVLANAAIATVAFVITLFVAYWAHRKAQKLSKKNEEKKLVIERPE